ncbi:hypothetical protein [Sphingobium nicotianae]|uniref:Uncharacterized protein n=1 Tax=Sphingobium nicotianae TaxID=2782607 RepID=A0A9X1DDA6_9SPHN|nr:hypothetical protein [Sphingobium nicotianae]MBT2187913.1 hypothetical protein [Sphingobium nicotianae]
MTRWLVLFLCLIPNPTYACSPVKGYRVPTNFELVGKASLIVLARVRSGPDDVTDMAPAVELEPVRVLKGVLPGDPLRVEGALAWNGDPIAAMPTPLSLSHVSTGIGACVRMFYPKGGLVVAMFVPTPARMKRDYPGSMMQIFDPFARVVEDVESEDGIWVRAVEVYVALQAGSGKAGLRAAVERKRAALAVQREDIAAQAMAADLAYYLDMTGSGKDRMAAQTHWKYLDLPDETAAFIGSASLKGAILRCRKGGTALEVYWPPEEGEASALRIGGQNFALTPASLELSPEMKSRSATVAFDGALDTALRTGTADAGMVTGNGAIVAPPLDILQKFGPRCAALRKPAERN